VLASDGATEGDASQLKGPHFDSVVMSQLKRTLLIGYFGGCGVYLLAQAIYGWELGFRGTAWLHGVALHAMYSPWWAPHAVVRSAGLMIRFKGAEAAALSGADVPLDIATIPAVQLA
jgi:hypothetical protein